MWFHFLNPIFPNMGGLGPKKLAILLLWHHGQDAVYLQRPVQVAKSPSPRMSHKMAGAQLARMRLAFPMWQAGLVTSGVMEQGRKRADGTR